MKLAVVLACCTVACGDHTDTGTREESSQSGAFTLVTRIDVSASALLPEPAYGYLETLRLLRDDPGRALLELVDPPFVDELPGVLSDRLGALITAAMPDGMREDLDLILDVADRSLASFEVVSELDVDGGGGATHTLSGLRFGAVAVALPRVAAELDATYDGERLSLGPHAFGLAYGERVYELLEAQSGGLRASLGAAVDCPAVAADVAGRCVLGVCVGHKAELEALCERGLDEVVARLHARLAALRFDVLRFDRGAGRLGQGGQLSGTWTAQANLGAGLRPVAATFSGAAVAPF